MSCAEPNAMLSVCYTGLAGLPFVVQAPSRLEGIIADFLVQSNLHACLQLANYLPAQS